MKELFKLSAAILNVFFALIFTPFIGYICGWLFEMVFTQTWLAMSLWLKVPDGISCGMLSAFVAFVTGLTRTQISHEGQK